MTAKPGAAPEISTTLPPRANRWRRFDLWDQRPLAKDQFAAEDPDNGFYVAQSPADSAPSLAIRDCLVVEMDGRLRPD